jgi:hypothetical protein
VTLPLSFSERGPGGEAVHPPKTTFDTKELGIGRFYALPNTRFAPHLPHAVESGAKPAESDEREARPSVWLSGKPVTTRNKSTTTKIRL